MGDGAGGGGGGGKEEVVELVGGRGVEVEVGVVEGGEGEVVEECLLLMELLQYAARNGQEGSFPIALCGGGRVEWSGWCLPSVLCGWQGRGQAGEGRD